MRILHPGVFPVSQLNSALIYQEIITDGVNVGEAVLLLLFVNKRLQREHSLPGFLIILMDTRPSPQALIKLNPVKDIMGDADGRAAKQHAEFESEEEATEEAKADIEGRIEQWKEDSSYLGETINDFDIRIKEI